MATEQERRMDRILDYLEREGRSGPRPTTQGSGNVDPNDKVATATKSLLDSLGKGLGTAYDVAGNLAGKALNQTATISDATGAVATILGKFGTAGGVAGDALTGLTNILVDAVDNWQYFSNFGMQFGGNALALNDAFKKTGLSINDYKDLVDSATPGFVNFGKGLSVGAEMFGDASQQLQNRFGQDLMKLGMGLKDMNSVLAITARGMVNIDPSSNGIDQLTSKASQLAREMDKMAQITGLSRKEQEKNIQAMQDDARIQAQIARLRRENPEKANSVNETLAAAGALDPATQKLVTELIAGGGITNTDKLANFVANSSAELGTKLQEITRMTTSDDPEERRQATEAMKNFAVDIAMDRGKEGSNSRFVERGAVSNDATAAMFGGAKNPYAFIQANLEPYIKKFGDEATARSELLKDIILMQENKQLGPRLDKDGKPIEGGGERGDDNPLAKTTQIVNNVNLEIKSIGASLNTLLGDINKSITTQRDKDNNFIIDKVVNATSGKSDSEYKNRIKDLEIQLAKTIEQVTGKQPKGAFDATSTPLTAPKFEDILKFLNPSQSNTTAPAVEPSSVTPNNSSSINTPGMNVLANVANVNTKVSSATEATPDTNNGVQIAESNTAQDKLVEKLGEISIIMARVEQHTKNTATYSKDTAANIKDVGPYA